MKQDKYEKPSWIATGIAIGIWLSVFIVGCVKCHAQNPATISKSETVQQDTIPVTIKAELPDNYYFLDGDTVAVYKAEWIPSVIYDTIPITILVRIQGRPWAFFHDGWEVMKVDSVRQQKAMTTNEHGFVPAIYLLETVPIYSHLLYLDSRKRPIRKEWVVYQTFKR